MKRLIRAATITALLLAWAPAARANQIANGGFERGSWANWTTTPAPSGSIFFVGGHPHWGRDAAWFGAIGSVDDEISQIFATIPGQVYVLDFWLAHGGMGGDNEFFAMWDDTPLLVLHNRGRNGYTEYTFQVTATDWTSRIEFGGRDLQNYYYLDDVSVNPAATATPEPASIGLLASGLAALALARRRQLAARRLA